MREYYLYEIEASEKPLLNKKEWQTVDSLTSNRHIAIDSVIIAYGEISENKYVALYKK